MRDKGFIVTYGYHFISEAIVIFLISYPIMNYYFDGGPPFWIYLGIVTGAGIAFSILTKYTTQIASYIAVIPLIGLAFYLNGFPIELCIGISLLLTWRYIRIRREAITDKEIAHFNVSLLMAILWIFIFQDIRIIMYLLVHLILLFVGNLSSHLIIMNRQDRKSFDHKIWVYLTGLFAFGSFSTWLLFDAGRFIISFIWQGIGNVFIYGANALARLFTGIDLQLEQQDEMIESNEGERQEAEMGQSLFEGVDSSISTTLQWIILAVIVCIILVFLLTRRRLNQLKQADTDNMVSYRDLEKEEEPKQTWKDRLNRFVQKPKHPVRKMVFQFERKAVKTKQARHPFETIENWFHRIGVNSDLSVYQKVRYGVSEATDEELAELKKELKRIEAGFNDRKVDE